MRVRLSRSMCADNWLLTVKCGLGAGNDELSALKCVSVHVCVVCLMTVTIRCVFTRLKGKDIK